jgi:hypothetical protein
MKRFCKREREKREKHFINFYFFIFPVLALVRENSKKEEKNNERMKE